MPPSTAVQLSQSRTTCLSTRFARLPGGRTEVLLHLCSQCPESLFPTELLQAVKYAKKQKTKNNVTSSEVISEEVTSKDPEFFHLRHGQTANGLCLFDMLILQGD